MTGDVKSNNSRNAWCPLLVKLGQEYLVMILWKVWRNEVKLLKKRKITMGNIVKCTYSDGVFSVKDILGAENELKDHLLDVSLIGGSNKLAISLCKYKSIGDFISIAELLHTLGNPEDNHPAHLTSCVADARVRLIA